MQNIAHDLIVGTLGSVIGAAIVYAFAYGFRASLASRATARKLFVAEVEEWKAAGLLGRQQKGSVYLFDILRPFLIGNMALAAGTMLDILPLAPQIGGLVAAGFFYAALGRLVRYSKIVVHDFALPAAQPGDRQQT